DAHQSFPYFLSPVPPAPTSTPFPYTTLFRSYRGAVSARALRLRDARLPALRMEVQCAQRSLAPCRRALRIRVRGHSALAHDHQRSEEHTSELQSRGHLVCRLLLEKNKVASHL